MALSSARFPPLLLLTLGLAVGLSELALPLLPETSLSGGSSALATGNVSRVGKAGGGGNSSLSGSSEAAGPGGKRKKEGEYSGSHSSDMMIQRALYVLIVVTAFVIIYFVVRTVRMRKVNRKTRKYGVLNTHLENMEMRPLDQEDDEEDDTLFDANHSRR